MPTPKQLIYDWNRLWLPFGATVHLDHLGFPFLHRYDFQTEKTITDALTLHQLAKVQCLILLGEPGSGKSSEVKKISHQDAYYLTYELNQRSSEGEIIKSITNNSKFRDWVSSEKTLFLYLDALDEALLNIKTIGNAIVSWVEENKEQFNIGSRDSRQLYLRITCRSAIWSEKTTAKLAQVFGPENVSIYELAPLTQSEIKVAARAHGFDESKFIETIVENDLMAFCTDPISLRFVMPVYESGRLLTAIVDKKTIFYEGAVHIATELNDSYREHVTLTAEERVRVASRIATYVIFCNKYSIKLDESQTDVKPNDLLVDDIIGDTFAMGGKDATIHLRSLKETCNTALFGLQDDSFRLSFRHKTYAEFLAAIQLNSQKLGAAHFVQLLASPFDQNRAIPQIQEVLIWLATMNVQVFRIFLTEEPLLMIRCHRIFTDDEKKKLVEAIIKQAEQYSLSDNDDARKYYKKLAYPGLAKQLKPALISKKNTISTRTAIDITGACRLTELADVLLKLAKDRKVDSYIRRESIASLGELDPKLLLAPLQQLLDDLHYDDADEIKGQLLKTLYPEYISVVEVVKLLIPQKRKNLYGSYKSFIDSFAILTRDQDLKAALNALLENQFVFVHQSANPFSRMLEKLVNRCWKEVGKTIEPKLMATFMKRLYENRIPFEANAPAAIRRSVAIEIIRQPENIFAHHIVWGVMRRSEALLTADDSEWLIETIKNVQDPIIAAYASGVLWRLIDSSNPTHTMQLLEVAHIVPELRHAFRGLLDEVDLDSSVAAELRSHFENEKQAIQNKANAANTDAVESLNIQETVLMHLEKFSASNRLEFWRIIHSLGLDTGYQSNPSHDFEFDITCLPIWSKLDPIVQQRIYEACKEYLVIYDAPETSWITSNEYHRPEMAGYKALFLLTKYDPTFIETLEDEFWSRWEKIIFYCSIKQYGDARPVSDYILIACYKKSKLPLVKTIVNYFFEKILQKENVYELYKIQNIIDRSVGSELLKLINVPHTRTNETILQTVFHAEIPEAREFALLQLKNAYRKKITDRPLAIASTALLFHYVERETWDVFWEKFITNTQLAKLIILKSGNVEVNNKFGGLLTLAPNQLGDVALWIYKNFPPEEDPKHNGVYSPSDRDHVGSLRGRIIKHLIETGTIESVTALKKLSEALPKEENAKFWIVSAREFLRKNSWTPLKIQYLKLLLNESKHRVVRSESDLIAVVEESLVRLQKRLQGDNPAAFFLWNSQRNNKYKPKEENTLSDFIKLHLDYDLKQQGIVINREVEIRRSTGMRDGQRTDLYVQAIGDESIPVTIVIEVKGCWHAELITAMRTQLKDRYLTEHKSTHGIYVTGWYHCKHFRPRTKLKKKELEGKLRRQASQLSNDNFLLKSIVLDCTI